MINVAKKSGNTSTGVHFLQRYQGGYRIRVAPENIKRLTSVEVKPQHLHLFGVGDLRIYHSKVFDTVPEGAKALCSFIETVCGVPCEWRP